MSGKHERAALDRLQAHARAPSAAVAAAADDAVADLLMARDILTGLRAAADLLIACEAIAGAAEETAKRLRVVLAEVMEANGVPALAMAHHVLSYVEPKPKPVVTDETLLPPEMFMQPPPKPDMQKIGAALKAGAVPGAAISNGGAGHVRLAPRKEKAA